MKRFVLTLVLALSAWTLALASEAYDLRCEAMTSPLGIDSASPHFSWKTRVVQQTWQIQVASDIKRLKSGKADLWDSGVQNSGDCVMVPYGGAELHSRQLCWWRVCVNGEWSRPERFSIGIIGDDALEGSYIGGPCGESPVLFTSFKVRRPSRTTFVRLNSLGYHELYINGRRVSETVLAPAVSQLDKRSRIVTCDITPFLRRGRNDIAVWMGKGWYRENTFGTAYDGPLLNASVDVLRKGEWQTVLVTDGSWKAVRSGYRDMGTWRPHAFGGEMMDAGAVPQDLRARALEKMEPEAVSEVEVKGIKATPQMCPANVLKETVTAVSIEPLGEGIWVADMGKAMNAQVEITVRGCHKGDTVKFIYDDRTEYAPDGEHFGNDILIAGGSGTDCFRSKFNHQVFRYVAIEGVPQKPEISDIKARRFGSCGEPASTFTSSDEDLNRIHDLVAYTMDNLTYSGYMVDCASIERLGYGGDGNASAQSLQTIYDVAPVYINWLQAWEDITGEDGHVRHTAPSPYTAGGGPYWCSFLVQVPWKTYMSYGDTRLLERCYDEMLRWVSYIDRYSTGGLLQRWPDDERRGWYLGDWLAPRGTDVMDRESIDLVANCAVSQSYADLIQIASVLGKESDAQEFRERKEKLDDLIHSSFYHSAQGIYGSGSQLDMAYPMLVGAVPQELQAKVEAKLIERTGTINDGHIGVGLVGVPVLAEWAVKSGNADLIYGMLKQRSYPGYLYMLDNGATATWEDWDNPRSQLHNCFNGIGSWFYQALGGITPDTAGYRHVTIAPQYPEGLEWVKVEQGTPYGTLGVSWKRENGRVVLHVDIPAGITAAVCGRELSCGSYDL